MQTFEHFIAEYFEGSFSAFFITITAGILAGWLLSRRRRNNRLQRDMRTAFYETQQAKVNDRNLSELDEKMTMATKSSSSEDEEEEKTEEKNDFVKIFYATQTGNAREFSNRLFDMCLRHEMQATVTNLANYDPEESLQKETAHLCVFIISTYTDGGPPDEAQWFHRWLSEAAFDFRVGASYLQDFRFVVVGLGNSLYKENFNRAAKDVDSWLRRLSAKPVLPLTLLDEHSLNSLHGGLEEDFQAWLSQFEKDVLSKKEACGKSSDSQCDCKGDACSPTENGHNGSEDEAEASEDEDDGLVDVEDLGQVVASKVSGGLNGEPKEMITPLLRKSLEKQGYRLLGTHSGVKMCRWTKAMLRGRGGCYKHSFYGIASHRCMEATPSLACANKCVFCWRHHTNPVGTEWRWRTDSPEQIVSQALEAHRGLIRQFRGVPGVRKDRFEEGLEVRHCALSLVGEPIMYPHINQMVQLLHEKGISSFLVTNAQFPEAIRQLCPVTQLYVSVDASTEDSLKKIDRPLFRDFWQRLLDSLRALEDKGQRTVYRLTLVKAMNTEQLDGYVRLVSIGKPDFIEVKGVTFCGDSKASKLTMQNVPWHQEVLDFCHQLTDRLEGNDYEIACEHEHSNCVLIASTKLKVNGRWHTWIDYDRFHDLFQRWLASDGQETFLSSDYMSPTPEWAVLGASERGFDPQETRFRRVRKKDASGQGCE